MGLFFIGAVAGGIAAAAKVVGNKIKNFEENKKEQKMLEHQYDMEKITTSHNLKMKELEAKQLMELDKMELEQHPYDETVAQPEFDNAGVCQACGEKLVAGAKFCLECGTKIVRKKYCGTCGSELDSNVKFCPFCGEKTENIGG